MRIFVAGALALLLAACSPPRAATQSAAAAECVRTATRDVTWSDASAPDKVTARAEGPTCAQVVVQLTIRNANGDPLWTVASTYYDMTIGGHSDAPAAVTPDQVDRFLASWVDVTINHSGELPEWREGEANLSASANGLSYNTSLDREMYEGLRQRNLPQLCFAAAADASQCMVMDPSSRAPIVLVGYGANS